MLAERGLHADHVTVWKWGQCYGPEIQRRLRPRLRPTNDSWRVDETYIRVKGKWVYFYRAVDSSGVTIDFLLSAERDAAAAERFLAKALGGANHPHLRVINTDKYAAYPPAIVQLKDERVLEENCQHRSVQYLNNVLEQDHRAVTMAEPWRDPTYRLKKLLKPNIFLTQAGDVRFDLKVRTFKSKYAIPFSG